VKHPIQDDKGMEFRGRQFLETVEQPIEKGGWLGVEDGNSRGKPMEATRLSSFSTDC
jgi:hypothetical protein